MRKICRVCLETGMYNTDEVFFVLFCFVFVFVFCFLFVDQNFGFKSKVIGRAPFPMTFIKLKFDEISWYKLAVVNVMHPYLSMFPDKETHW